MAADRGAFIDQSQSMNVFMSEANFSKLTSMHFYAWKRGLKTGLYYLRTRAAADAIQFTLDAKAANTVTKPVEQEEEVVDLENIKPDLSESQRDDIARAKMICSLNNPDDCAMCGS